MAAQLPGYPPGPLAPALPDRSASTARTAIWIVAAAIGVLLLVPCAGFFIWMFGGPDPDDARAEADRFLVRVESGDDAAAYESMCPATKRHLSYEDFDRRMEGLNRPVTHTVTHTALLTAAGRTASVDVEVRDTAGTVRTITFSLELGDNGWQVCDENVG